MILAATWHPLPSQGQKWKADAWLEFDYDVELRLMEREQLRLEMGHVEMGHVQTGTVGRGWSRLRLSLRLRAGGAAALSPCPLPSSPSPCGYQRLSWKHIWALGLSPASHLHSRPASVSTGPSQGPSHCLPPVLPNMSSVSWACQDFGSLFIRPLLPHLQRLCSTAFFPECLSCWSQQATACPSPSPEVRSTTSIWGLKLHVWVRCSPGREQLFLLTSNFFFMPHHLSHFQVSANCLPKTPQRLIHLHLYLLFKKILRRGLPCCLSGKESACQCRRHGFDPWSKKIPHAYKQLSPSTTPPEPVL